ncbi:MAG TPA: transcription antitermination factor NusB, partial [Myxococcales bacterium]|nr:transcription antitermination factor NusB [Myxococcales bacterium]
MGSRTKARECALQALYQLDLSGGDPRDAVRGVLAHFEDADDVTGRFADELVRGVQSERGQIDAIIQRSSTHWKLERMAR